MVKGGRLAAIAGLALLGACTRPVDDPLAVHSIYWGLAPMPDYEGALPEVLFSAADTPDQQGLLYTAMVEAEVAAQYAGRALAADDAVGVRGALGEVLYAIDPARGAGVGRQGGRHRRGLGGHGLRPAPGRRTAWRPRSARRSRRAMARRSREYGPPAARCADNTLARADQIVALVDQTLDARGDPDRAAAAADPRRWPIELNGGAGGAGDADPVDPECGLQQAERYLDQVAPGRG